MPLFHYKAKKGSAETVAGEIEAQTQEEAIEVLNRQGLLPVSIEEKKYPHQTSSTRLRSGKIRQRDVFVFSQQLANLTKAGISILRALSIINEQTQNVHFKNIIAAIKQGIKDGHTLSQCLAQHPKVFSLLYIAMVRVGEEGGSLKEMLIRISEYQRRQEEMFSRVRSALAYPVLMAAVGFATVLFILTFVMPRITHLFIDAGEALPLPTQILLSVSAFLRAGWIGILIAVIVAISFFNKWSHSTAGQLAVSQFKLRLPLFGQFILKAELTRFTRTLELLLKSGVSLQKAMAIAVPTLDNEQLKKDLSGFQKELESGSSLGNAFKNSRLIPAMMINLILVGEESGMLEETLADISESYEQETNETIKTMTTLLEPMMILIVGSVVGFIVIAMLLPIFQMDVLAR